jgi:hypothetical protein
LHLGSVIPETGWGLPIVFHGVVRGDVRISNGGEQVDRIDFGDSFRNRDSRSRHVTISSQIAGLDLELLLQECTPAYLQPTLKLQDENDGKKRWTLTVNIPEGKLYGELEGGFVVLRTKASPPRKIMIPVRAKTYD